jgi:hypothetical protein
LFLAKVLNKGLGDGLAEQLFESQRLGDGGQYQLGVGQSRQADKPHAIGEVFEHLCSYLQRQAGLADASSSGHRHQAHLGTPEDPVHRRELLLSAQKDSRLDRKVMGASVQGFQGWKVARQLSQDQLRHGLRMLKILESIGSQLAQRRAFGQIMSSQCSSSVREQNLATVASRSNPGGPMDVEPDIPVSHELGRSGV